MINPRFAWTLALGCTVTTPSSTQVSEAFQVHLAFSKAAANASDAHPSCLALPDERDRGLCVAALALVLDDPQVCDGLSPRWREECGFMRSEQARREGDWTTAVSRCAGLDLYRNDCLDHAWRVRRPPEELGRALDAALAAGMKLHEPRGAALAREAMRRMEAVDVTMCAGDAGCLVVAADVVVTRWRVELDAPGVRDTLCRGGTPPLDRLRVPDVPVIQDAVAALRSEVCRGPGHVAPPR